MSLTSRPYILGVYRQRATVHCGNRIATVYRVPDPNDSYWTERYAVGDSNGRIHAVCWRHGVPEITDETAPQYDGGWQRAVALAEQLITETTTTTGATAP